MEQSEFDGRRRSKRLLGKSPKAQQDQTEDKQKIVVSPHFQKSKRQKVVKKETDNLSNIKVENGDDLLKLAPIKQEEEEYPKNITIKTEMDQQLPESKKNVQDTNDTFRWKQETEFVDIEDLYKNVLPQNPYVDAFDEEKFYKKYPQDEPGPPNWRVIYSAVKQMRSKVVAPVDTVGCERIAERTKVKKVEVKYEEEHESVKIKKEEDEEQHLKTEEEEDIEVITEKDFRFHLFVALLLSSQTKDQMTAKAVENLKQGLNYAGTEKETDPNNTPNKKPPGLSVATILATPEHRIDQLIYCVGFHKRKAGYLRRCSEVIRDKYGGDIPPMSVRELVNDMPGFGPKMGHLYVQRAYGTIEGIGVDVHVHRLAKMWGWTRWRPKEQPNEKPRAQDPSEKVSKNPDDPQFTRVRLEAWLPEDLWVDINPTLVGFGQTICPSRGARCDRCLVGARVRCPGKRSFK